MGIEGSLAEMNAMDLIQSVAPGDKNVKITLESNNQRGIIYIRGGEIIHTEIGKLKGEEAFYQMMAFRDGEFQVVSCTDFPSRTIRGSTMSLLMEGARLVDEAAGQPDAETQIMQENRTPFKLERLRRKAEIFLAQGQPLWGHFFL